MDKLKLLFSLARRPPPDVRVPYGFEQRIMHRLRRSASADPWALWALGLWRAVAPSLGIALLLSAWLFLPGAGSLNADPDNDLSAALEEIITAAPAETGAPAW